MNTRRIRKGFTLVEILIVVVILGILAAVVVPQFTNAADDARGGNLEAQLKTIQNQIELFSARESAALDLTANWNQLTTGNYLKAAPVNPAWPTAATASTISAGATGTGSATTAWFYNTTDQTIYASYYDEANDAISATATD